MSPKGRVGINADFAREVGDGAGPQFPRSRPTRTMPLDDPPLLLWLLLLENCRDPELDLEVLSVVRLDRLDGTIRDPGDTAPDMHF